jgi:hypothetical protein
MGLAYNLKFYELIPVRYNFVNSFASKKKFGNLQMKCPNYCTAIWLVEMKLHKDSWHMRKNVWESRYLQIRVTNQNL